MTKHHQITRKAALLLAGSAFAAAIAQPAMAQNRWDGSDSTDYNDPANWSQNSVPGAVSSAQIDTLTNAPVVQGAQIAHAGTLRIGEEATGALNVQNGGALVLGDQANGGLLTIGGSQTTNATGGNGHVIVTGAGSTISGPLQLTLQLGLKQDSIGLLEILDGAVVTSATGQLGIAPNASGTITVSGAGSQWNINSGAAGVIISNNNFANARGALNVLDGGVVSYGTGVGWTLGRGGTITVDGAGSQLNVGTDITAGGDISITGGGSATIARLTLGDATRANSLTVSGQGSTLRATELLVARFGGSNTTVLVENGGQLFSDEAPVAGIVAPATATFTVTGAGSLWQIAADSNNNPKIGAGVNVATLNVLAGGRVESLTGFNFEVSQSSNVLLSGAGSLLDINGNISIQSSNGGQGVGSFVVENGASLRTHGTSDNGLGFGVRRDVVIRSGGSWIMDGGTNAGLQIESSQLLVDNATFSATGAVSIGLRFSGTDLILRNSDFTARALNVGSVGGNQVTIGTRADGTAGGVGAFNVGSIALTAGNTLEINHTSSNFVLASTITGAGTINHLAGTTVFTGGQAGFSGQLNVEEGTVVINGTLGGNASRALFDSEFGPVFLRGTGTFGGDVTVGNATFAPGNSAGTFTIGGDLVLGSSSVLDFELGAPNLAPGNGSDLINVGGDLTLDGTLNITALNNFGSGLYRLINYGGALTDNGLEFGVVPVGFEATGLTLDVATAGQVNLIAAAAEQNFIFWDGANASANGQIDGGTGTWTTTATNWTILEGTANGAFDPADFLIFRGPTQAPQEAGVRTTLAVQPSASAGTVTIDNSAGAVTLANGVQFAISGYTVTGGNLGLQAGDILFRVGDGSKVGADFSATIASAITGPGGLVKDDFGTLILTGANTYSGGTSINAGILQGNSASLQGAMLVATEGTLLFDQASTGTYAGSIGGSGFLIKEGAGTLVLTGSSTGFAGETSVTAGTLRVNGTLGSASSALFVSDGATLGGSGVIGGNVAVNDGVLAPGNSPGTLTINGNLSLTAASILNYELGAPIGGTGAASDVVNVGGNLVLDGTLNVTGGTGFGAGLYRIFNFEGTLTDNGLALGSMPSSPANLQYQVDVATAGQVNLLAVSPDFDFIFWDGAQMQANGLIDGGTGTWTVANTNWTTLEADNNGAFDPADFLIFRAPEQDQSTFLRSTTAATPSASTGTVTVDNTAGQVSLANGVQFATTGYTVTGGSILLAAPEVPCDGECSPTPGQVIVRVGDGSEAGAAFVATIESALTGTSGLAKTDLGTLILTGANTYSGGTLVEAGTLQGNAASLQGTFAIGPDATLLFNQAANGTFAGTIFGNGEVVKEGAGTLAVTGDSSAYNGVVRLAQGGINLSGELGGAMITSAGTRLSGTGRTEDLDLGGTIAPGNSIGTFDVNGELVFRAGSTYEVELAANGTGDFILADDVVTIEGGTVAVSLLDPETSYVDGTTWTIIEGEEGVTGTFSGLTENSAFLDFVLGYSPDTVFLTLDLVRQFPDVALTFNQKQASLGLAELGQASGSDSLAVYNALLMLDGDTARAAFDASSGEIYADVLASGLRAARERLAARQLDVMARGEEGWQLWLAGGVSDGHVNADGNGARFTRSGKDVELGADYHGADNAWAVSVSGGWNWADVNNAARASAANLDGFFLSGFARHGDYGAGLTASVAGSYTTADGEVVRQVAFPGITRTAASRIDSSARALSLDLRYGIGFDSLAVGPAAGLEYAWSRIGSYAEFGAGALDLAGNGSSDKATRITVGGFVSYTGDAGALVFDARYVDGRLDNSQVEHSLSGSPRSFVVLPARGSANGARLSGTAELDLGGGMMLGASATAFFAGEESELYARAQVRMAF